MNMRVVSLVLIIAVTAVGLFAQKTVTQSPSKDSHTPNATDFFGEIADREYTNRFFRFGFTIPAAYTIINRDQANIYLKAGVDTVKRSGNSETPLFDKAVGSTIPLIGVVQKPVGSVDNAALEIVVVGQPNDKITANMVLAASLTAMMQTSKFSINKDLGTTTIGGQSFVGVELNNTAFGTPMMQRTFVTVRNSYAIMITVVYRTENGLSAFDETIKSFDFGLK